MVIWPVCLPQEDTPCNYHAQLPCLSHAHSCLYHAQLHQPCTVVPTMHCCISHAHSCPYNAQLRQPCTVVPTMQFQSTRLQQQKIWATARHGPHDAQQQESHEKRSTTLTDDMALTPPPPFVNALRNAEGFPLSSFVQLAITQARHLPPHLAEHISSDRLRPQAWQHRTVSTAFL